MGDNLKCVEIVLDDANDEAYDNKTIDEGNERWFSRRWYLYICMIRCPSSVSCNDEESNAISGAWANAYIIKTEIGHGW